MSRVEKYSRQKSRQHETDLQVNHETIEKDKLPPRTRKYMSSKQKMSKFFYNLIFVVFVLLVTFLFIYGYRYTNGGE